MTKHKDYILTKHINKIIQDEDSVINTLISQNIISKQYTDLVFDEIKDYEFLRSVECAMFEFDSDSYNSIMSPILQGCFCFEIKKEYSDELFMENKVYIIAPYVYRAMLNKFSIAVLMKYKLGTRISYQLLTVEDMISDFKHARLTKKILFNITDFV